MHHILISFIYCMTARRWSVVTETRSYFWINRVVLDGLSLRLITGCLHNTTDIFYQIAKYYSFASNYYSSCRNGTPRARRIETRSTVFLLFTGVNTSRNYLNWCTNYAANCQGVVFYSNFKPVAISSAAYLTRDVPSGTFVESNTTFLNLDHESSKLEVPNCKHRSRPNLCLDTNLFCYNEGVLTSP
jgi:hypothetical protein